MQIKSIELRNYRLFRHAKLTDLPPMATLVGANGSGKSTLFDALSFLKDALKDNVADAVAQRGGFRELVSRGESGRPGSGWPPSHRRLRCGSGVAPNRSSWPVLQNGP